MPPLLPELPLPAPGTVKYVGVFVLDALEAFRSARLTADAEDGAMMRGSAEAIICFVSAVIEPRFELELEDLLEKFRRESFAEDEPEVLPVTEPVPSRAAA